MIKLKTRRNKMPAIMLSPMIDMMFLLLIFFGDYQTRFNNAKQAEVEDRVKHN